MTAATLGFVSPLPPVRSGIADYSADLLPALRAQIDLETYVPSEARRAFSSGHEAVLLQVGNDPLHLPSVEALRENSRRVPSILVLHDYSLHHLFAAAFLGNMYHHLLAQPEHVVRLDLPRLWAEWSPRLLYCFLLALGIWVSMLRQQRLRAAGSAAGAAVRLRRIAGVWTFYSLIHIWNLQGDGIDLAACARFFLSLFGI